MTQLELQREYQRNLDEQQMAEHMSARIALEQTSSLYSRSQDLHQPQGINGHPPSVIASTVNNESFYHQRSTTLHSGTNGAKGRQNHSWIDGRRHHNTEQAPYVLPNDIDEMDR